MRPSDDDGRDFLPVPNPRYDDPFPTLADDNAMLVADNQQLRAEIERLREYRDHHEFVMSQLAEMLNVKISAVGDLVEVFRAQLTEVERLRDTEYNPAMFCKWICDHEGMYVTGCERAWEFVDGDLSENHVKYCPFCGGRIQAAKAGGDDE